MGKSNKSGVADMSVAAPTQRSSGSKGGKRRKSSSRKAYYASGPSRIPRNKARAAARRAKRKAYWASAAGQDRKATKMNTPEKLKAREVSKVALAARRRQRMLDEQKAAREQTLQNERVN